MESRPKIEVVRVPSTERGNFRPLDGVQLRAAYSHVRIGTYCPEPELEPEHEHDASRRIPGCCELKPPHEHSRKYKKNLGPVSRLLRRRHHATSLATKSCDNIYNVNKNNNFFEWKHGHSCPNQGMRIRQSKSLDWRVGRNIERNSGNLEYRKASRSAEHLSRSGHQQTPSTKSKIVSLLRRLSPRLPRPSSKGSMPSSPNGCPWLQIEYTNAELDEVDAGAKANQDLTQENDQSFQRELRLNEIRKRAVEASKKTSQELVSDKTVKTKEKKIPCTHPQLNVQIQQAENLNSTLQA